MKDLITHIPFLACVGAATAFVLTGQHWAYVTGAVAIGCFFEAVSL